MISRFSRFSTFFRILLRHFPNDPVVIGIPYSSKKKAAEDIKALGAAVSIPPFEKIYESVERGLIDQFSRCEDHKVLILEDGGYAAPIFHSDSCSKYHGNCLGVVEQTKNGLWRDREISCLKVPIAHVAESQLKDSVEGPAVGEAVARTIEWILGSLGISLASKMVGILGYGTIGMNIAKEMKKREAIVMCNDTLILRHIAARRAGVLPTVKADMLGKADLVIGATGKPSMDVGDILRLKHGAFIASASSKNTEINVGGLENVCRSVKSVHREVDRYRLVNGKDVFLMSKGFPVNFRGEFSIPNDIMDLIFCELFLCTIGVARGDFPIGISGITVDAEQAVASIWEKLYS